MSAAFMLAELPPRPWTIHVDALTDGDVDYQVQSADGQVLANFLDGDFDVPGAAAASALFLASSANALEGLETLIDGDDTGRVLALRQRAVSP